MVKAILEGRKTQTRRVVRGRWALDFLQPGGFSPRYVALPENYLSPYGYSGDLLWVRETWAPELWDNAHPLPGDPIIYREDYCGEALDYPWKPSIFMPRWASRITLKITNVRVERLQEISEEDAINEGGAFRKGEWGEMDAFNYIWDSINAKRGYSWDSNPWAWVIEFEMVKGG